MSYFVSLSPNAGEQSQYSRYTIAFVFTSGTFNWVWGFDSAQSSSIRARMVIDGVPGPWVSPVSGQYTFSVSVPNGHHIAMPETELAGTTVFGAPFVVNDTALPLAVQNPWVAQRRVPGEYQLAQLQPKQVSLPAAPPYIGKMKARTLQPVTTRLTMAQQWARRWSGYHRNMFSRRFWKTLAGDTIIAGEQRYEYSAATSLGSYLAGIQIPAVQVRDGPRGVGTLGYVAKLMLRRNGKGVYFLETNGRMGHMQFGSFDQSVTSPALVAGEGYINTFVGWRVAGTPTWEPDAANGVRHANNEGGWEYCADWSRVSGVQRLHEPWGFAVAFPKAGGVDNRDGLDFWVCDTLNHRILYVDAWAAHADVSAITGHPTVPRYAPPGYVFPGHVGKAQVVPFLDNIPEAWDCDVNPIDGKLYFSSFAGDAIYRCNLDASGVEKVVGRDVALTDAQLGIPQRLYPSSIALATLRATHLVDGTSALVTRPQAIAFDAAGNLFWIEKYTYALRKWDRATGVVTTIKQLPVTSIGIGSAETHDFAMAIDVAGSFGPVGDIFVSGWAGGAHWRISADGSYIANIAGLAQRTMRNGPGDYVDPPNYAWGIAVQDGRLLWSGNDSTTGQLIEYSKKLATDPAPNQALFDQGASVWKAYFLLTHGHDGYNDLGYPNIEQMGSWSDATISNYAAQWGVPEASLPALTYYIRWSTTDLDYTADTVPPAAPTVDLSVNIAWS